MPGFGIHWLREIVGQITIALAILPDYFLHSRGDRPRENLVSPVRVVTVKAHENAVEIVNLAQPEEPVRKNHGVMPELQRRDIELQQHVSDAELAHQWDTDRRLQVHCVPDSLSRSVALLRGCLHAPKSKNG